MIPKKTVRRDSADCSARLPRVVLGAAVLMISLAIGTAPSALRAAEFEALQLFLPAADGSSFTAAAAPAGAETGSTVLVSAASDGCRDSDAACRDALATLRDDDIAGIDLDIRVGGTPGSDYPCECRLEGETFKPRRFAGTMFTWKAAGYCHKPLYFEHWTLERYGHSYGWVDPILSGAHFFATLPVLPYKMGVELPWECVYPLGYYRPGSCAPWTVPAVPISKRGLALEAATVTGLVFLLP